MSYKIVDAFAGCGGLSHGFVRTGDYETVLGTDIDEAALETFAHNHATSGIRPITISGDIRKLLPEQIVARLTPLGLHVPGSIDVLMGGPPCEGFSQNRRHEIQLADGTRVFTRNPLDSRDPRNELFRYFLALAAVMLPRVILIENVPQLTTSFGGALIAEILHTLDEMGYNASWKILNASEYGVPQIRRRAFVVATRKGHEAFSWPLPTNRLLNKTASDLPEPVSVADAISDLPPATSRELGRGPSKRYLKATSEYAEEMQSLKGTPINHVVRVPGARVLERLRAMKPGMITADMPENLKPKSHFYNAYARLSWDRPAKTITKSCNYLGSGCFGHPTEDRGITMREAARLQSFDDDFVFLSASEPHIAKMIGGAVPPLLSAAIARRITAWLQTADALTDANSDH